MYVPHVVPHGALLHNISENHTKDPQPEFRVTSLDPAALLQLKTRYVCVERCGKKHTA